MSSNTSPAESLKGSLAPRYRPRELKVIGPPSMSRSMYCDTSKSFATMSICSTC